MNVVLCFKGAYLHRDRTNDRLTARFVFALPSDSKKLALVVKTFSNGADGEPSLIPGSVKIWDQGVTSLDRTIATWRTRDPYQPSVQELQIVHSAALSILEAATRSCDYSNRGISGNIGS